MEVSQETTSISHLFDVFLISLIILNVLALILETVPEYYQQYGSFFYIFEVASIIFFTLEYILRIYSISEDPEYAHPVTGRLKYSITPLAIIDLLAFLPFYLPLIGIDLRFFRMLRIFRLLRLFKVTRYFTPLIIIMDVIRNKKQELSISVLFLIFMLVFLSCIMYFVEHEAQPEVFTSIPATMWYGVATLTTVGYGDVYPITVLGRITGGCIAIIGIGFFALPAGILTAGFTEEISKRNNNKTDKNTCPSCGTSY